MKETELDSLLSNPALAANRGFSSIVSRLIRQHMRRKQLVFVMMVLSYVSLFAMIFVADGNTLFFIDSVTEWLAFSLDSVAQFIIGEFDLLDSTTFGDVGLLFSLPAILLAVLAGIYATE